MKYVQITIVFLGSFLYVNTFGQSKYSKYIVKEAARHEHIVKNEYGDEKINYLGVIKNSNGDTLYYVITLFSNVQAARVMHGHSSVLYLNKKKDLVKEFTLNLPDELPYLLKNNVLYFKYFDEKLKKKQVYQNHVGIEIPIMLCVEPGSCF